MGVNIYLSIILAPLISAVLVGFLGNRLGKAFSHTVAILGVFVATVLSFWVFNHHVIEQAPIFNENIYTWLSVGNLSMHVGLMIDNLSAVMMVIVNFVSLMVHIYTIGYMKDDESYARFFSYISLFTFAMLMLVMSNNFLQLFFGWEAVGLVSYLLIGFWFQRESAIFANMKAFLVNRVGDFGFLLGIALIVMYTESLDYQAVFGQSQQLLGLTIGDFSLMTVICLLLFVGAMGKSAQVPLHVWLPDSMEGPTPISALIHAATMVTAGIFMLARMSPLFELSETALIVVMLIGAITALSMGLLGCVQNDIKRVVAYSTLSQLGYMTVALGVSAYSVAIFHLLTHAFFKALLFLAAGSVIVALHHQQDMRHMGALWRKMPVTYITALIGTLALIGMPGFAGFFSKDLIIEAAHLSNLLWAQEIVYPMLVIGVLITAFYSFRLIFMVFHGQSRHQDDEHHPIKESPIVITLPLILLAIPSIFVGYYLVEEFLLGKILPVPILSDAIYVSGAHNAMSGLRQLFESPVNLMFHAFYTPTFYAMLLGIVLAYVLVIAKPNMADSLANKLAWFRYILKTGYGFDAFNQNVLAKTTRQVGQFFSRICDQTMIDNGIVNGCARLIALCSGAIKRVQSGYIYHYAFVMIIGLVMVLSYVLLTLIAY